MTQKLTYMKGWRGGGQKNQPGSYCDHQNWELGLGEWRWEREGRDGCQREIPERGWTGFGVCMEVRRVKVHGAFVPEWPGEWSCPKQKRESWFRKDMLNLR